MESLTAFAKVIFQLQKTVDSFNKMRSDTTDDEWESLLNVPIVCQFIDEMVELEYALEECFS